MVSDAQTGAHGDPASAAGVSDATAAQSLLWRVRRSPRSRRLIVVGALVALGALLLTWRHFAIRESTDDAQVDGHITPVAASVSGRVVRVLVDDNQVVEAGGVLVEIDPADYRLAVARAEAELASARADAEAARAGVPITVASSTGGFRGAEARVRRARAAIASAAARLTFVRARAAEARANREKAVRDRERFAPLVAKEEISRQQFDAVEAAATAASAATDAADAAVIEAEHGEQEAEQALIQAEAEQGAAATGPEQVNAAKAREAAATGRLKRAEAALEQARLNLSYTTVVAPARGVISKRSVEVGQVVAAGQPLMALVAVDDIWITANFKETQLHSMRPGQPARVSVDAYGRVYRGHVDSISPATGARFALLPAENSSGNYVKVVQRVPVKIVLDKGQDDDHLLRPGMSVVPTVITH